MSLVLEYDIPEEESFNIHLQISMPRINEETCPSTADQAKYQSCCQLFMNGGQFFKSRYGVHEAAQHRGELFQKKALSGFVAHMLRCEAMKEVYEIAWVPQIATISSTQLVVKFRSFNTTPWHYLQNGINSLWVYLPHLVHFSMVMISVS